MLSIALLRTVEKSGLANQIWPQQSNKSLLKVTKTGKFTMFKKPTYIKGKESSSLGQPKLKHVTREYAREMMLIMVMQKLMRGLEQKNKKYNGNRRQGNGGRIQRRGNRNIRLFICLQNCILLTAISFFIFPTWKIQFKYVVTKSINCQKIRSFLLAIAPQKSENNYITVAVTVTITITMTVTVTFTCHCNCHCQEICIQIKKAHWIQNRLTMTRVPILFLKGSKFRVRINKKKISPHFGSPNNNLKNNQIVAFFSQSMTNIFLNWHSNCSKFITHRRKLVDNFVNALEISLKIEFVFLQSNNLANKIQSSKLALNLV